MCRTGWFKWQYTCCVLEEQQVSSVSYSGRIRYNVTFSMCSDQIQEVKKTRTTSV